MYDPNRKITITNGQAELVDAWGNHGNPVFEMRLKDLPVKFETVESK